MPKSPQNIVSDKTKNRVYSQLLMLICKAPSTSGEVASKIDKSRATVLEQLKTLERESWVISKKVKNRIIFSVNKKNLIVLFNKFIENTNDARGHSYGEPISPENEYFQDILVNYFNSQVQILIYDSFVDFVTLFETKVKQFHINPMDRFNISNTKFNSEIDKQVVEVYEFFTEKSYTLRSACSDFAIYDSIMETHIAKGLPIDISFALSKRIAEYIILEEHITGSNIYFDLSGDESYLKISKLREKICRKIDEYYSLSKEKESASDLISALLDSYEKRLKQINYAKP